MTGYVFLGFGFGILLHSNGYGVLWSAAMSLFIYAGSMQYMTISLLSGGAGLLTAALTTLVSMHGTCSTVFPWWMPTKVPERKSLT